MPKPYPREFRRRDRCRSAGRSVDGSGFPQFRGIRVVFEPLAGHRRQGRGTSGSTPTMDQFDPSQVRELLKRNKQLEQENEILRRATAYFARDTLPK